MQEGVDSRHRLGEEGGCRKSPVEAGLTALSDARSQVKP